MKPEPRCGSCRKEKHIVPNPGAGEGGWEGGRFGAECIDVGTARHSTRDWSGNKPASNVWHRFKPPGPTLAMRNLEAECYRKSGSQGAQTLTTAPRGKINRQQIVLTSR